MAIQIKRVYDSPAVDDGTRVLVDRIWPRGMTKDEAAVALWMKEAAPSSELRKWFGHDPVRWDEFRQRYFAELDQHSEVLKELKALGRKGRVTLLFGAKDTHHNNAVALREYLQGHR